MKNAWVVIGIVLIIGVGTLFFLSRKSAVPVPEQRGIGTPETATTPVVSEQAPSLISSFKEAMGMGRNMRCTYTGGNGDAAYTATAYVDGQKFRSETAVNGITMTVVSDGETQYVWNSGSSQGFKMSKACLESLKGAQPESKAGSGSQPAPQNYEAALDAAQNVRCEAAEAVDFSVPSDVTFADQCALMEQNKKMMEQVKGLVPAGTYPGQ